MDVTKLKLVSKPNVGYSSEVNGNAFFPIADAFGLALASPDYHFMPEPRIGELVTKGPEAIPQLLEYIDDESATDCWTPIHGSAVLTDHLDQLEADVWRNPNSDSLWEMAESVDRYNLRVGDLCYVALGQIVNRIYSAVYYMHTLTTVIDSPVSSAKMAAELRRQWTGCNREQHQRRLIADLQAADDAYPGRRNGAAVRLLYYYFAEAQPIIVQELQRDLFCEFESSEFGSRVASLYERDQVSAAITVEAWIDRLAIGELYGLRAALSREKSNRPEFTDLIEANLLQIRRHINESDVPAAVSSSDQARFVASLASFESDAIGDAVFSLLLETYERKGNGERYENVLLECSRYAVRTRHADETRAICRRLAGSPVTSEPFRDDFDQLGKS